MNVKLLFVFLLLFGFHFVNAQKLHLLQSDSVKTYLDIELSVSDHYGILKSGKQISAFEDSSSFSTFFDSLETKYALPVIDFKIDEVKIESVCYQCMINCNHAYGDHRYCHRNRCNDVHVFYKTKKK